MGRRIHPQLRRALGLIALSTVLVLAVVACGGEGGDNGEASPGIDEATSVGQEPAAQGTDRTVTVTYAEPSRVVLAEIDEKGGEEEYVKYLALEEVDPFWAQQFARWADSQQYTGGEGGPSYTNADAVIITDEPLETGGCGVVKNEQGETNYCPWDTTIYLSLREMMEGAEVHGPFFITYAVAHEWGHHVQSQLGYAPEGFNAASGNARALENHADCLAGVWARSYYERGHLDRTAILEGINLAYDIGDDQPKDGEDWGTTEERARWCFTGYTSGDFSGCSGALPDALR